MTSFAAIAGAMLLLALGFVLPALLRRRGIGPDAVPGGRGTALGLAVSLPLCALLVYGFVGQPGALSVPSAPESIDILRSRLARAPDTVDDLRQLARAYEAVRRFDDAVATYRRLAILRPDDADLLVDQAVTLGMTRQERLAGEPEQLIEQALALSPGHVQALALSGSARFEQGDYAGAVSRWRRLLQQVPADSEVAVSIAGSIAKAEARSRGAARPAGDTAR